MPGETITIIGGVLASFGIFRLAPTLTVAITGAIVGDNIGYWLGRRLGRPWLDQHGHRIGLRPDMLARVDALFARHGGKAVLIGRFVGFLRAMAPFTAGASRMSYATFLINNAIGATVWGFFFVLLGYSLGASWPIAERWLGRVGIVVGTLVIVATVIWLKRGKKRKGARKPKAE